MRKIYCLFMLIAFVFVAPLAGHSQAKVQFIHNSADITLDSVDVYINKSKALDDFKYGYASEFMTGPSGVPLIIDICDPTSTSPETPLYTTTTVLQSGSKYLAISNGMLDATGYDPFQPFSVTISGLGKELANVATNTDVLFYHGSTDAPVLDIYETGVGLGRLANNLAYNAFDGYNELLTNNYAIELRDSANTQMLYNFQLNLQSLGLQGKAVVALTTGFVTPSANNNGREFGMKLALPAGGELISLPVVPLPMASMQLVHNAADLSLANVDVWVNNKKLVSNFKFRNALSFTDIQAEQATEIKFLPANSTGTETPFLTYNVTFADTKKYILVFNGIASQSGYSPLKPIAIYSFDEAITAAAQPTNTAMMFFHGATDGAAIDIVDNNQTVLVDNLSYGAFDGYKEVVTFDYIFDVKDQAGAVMGRYSAMLATDNLFGKSILVLASGFVTPSSNSNGPAFGLFYVTPEGGVFTPMPVYTEPVTAEVQFIHNSADALLSTVDIWLNDGLIDDDITYKRASAYHTISAGNQVTVSVLPSNSTSHETPIVSKQFTPESGKKYLVFLDGIASTTGYDPIKPVALSIYSDAQINAATPGKIDALFHHGGTDADLFSVYDMNIGLVSNILDFGATNGYYELNEGGYYFNLINSENVVFKSFAAPLADLGFTNKTVTLVVSGFLNPANNSNGQAFGMFAIAGTGGAFTALNDITGTPEISTNTDVSLVPNPSRGKTQVKFTNLKGSQVQVMVFDLTGNKVFELITQTPENNLVIDTRDLNEGLYFVKIKTSNMEVTRKLSVVK